MNAYREPPVTPPHAWEKPYPACALEWCLNGCGVRRFFGTFPFVREETPERPQQDHEEPRYGKLWSDVDPGCTRP